MPHSSSGLVLAGGGVGGIAWELGVLNGLSQGGVDATTADLIVGTSAGSTVGAQIASGTPLAQLGATQLAERSQEIHVDVDVDEFRATMAALVVDAPDPQTALARVGRMALGADTVDEGVRRAVIAARLPVHEWPERQLVVTAVDAVSGELRVFDRMSGVALVDAVAASCAVPGIWPPVTIDGRRYIDGGARSLTNADLAVGHDRVLVLVPMELEGPAREQLDAELAHLGDTTGTHVIAADEASLRAIGPKPLDPAIRPAAYRAGLAQGTASAGELAGFWA